MPINKPSFTTQSVTQNPVAIIKMSPSRPPVRTKLDPPELPNMLVGYYNPQNQTVELFCTSPAGDYYFRVTG